jgi:TRAP-type mannitol/chloroaromatic compound transport system permease large subunit
MTSNISDIILRSRSNDALLGLVFFDLCVNRTVGGFVAILVAVNLQTSFLTPPFGFALFYMKGVAPSVVKMQDIYRGIIPFVVLQVIGIAIVLLFPQLALWLPSLVFE